MSVFSTRVKNSTFQGQPQAHVGTEMSLHVLAYNLKRVMRILGVAKMMKAVRLVGA
ncbi:hypothetical protein [Variovorax gossypii]